MRILVFDNYDSFTYNLVHYLEMLTVAPIEVHRNDKITLKEIEKFDKIVLSPGSGIPSESGILLDVIKTYAVTKSILGICLGQQAIVEAFGGSLRNLDEVFHGVSTPATIIVDDILFKNIPRKINIGRYHSWVAEKNNFPEELQITALDEVGEIMALRHKKYDIRAVQFHPESILTEFGLQIMDNWINLPNSTS